MRYGNVFDFWFDKRQRYVIFMHAYLGNSTVSYENRYSFIFMKFDVEEKEIICQNFAAGVAKVL